MSKQEIRKLIINGDNGETWDESSNRYLEAIAKLLYNQIIGEEFTPDPSV